MSHIKFLQHIMAIWDGSNTLYQSMHHLLHFLQSLILLYGKESYTGMHRRDLAGASFPIRCSERHRDRFLGRICHSAGEHTVARAQAGKSMSTSPPASWSEKHTRHKGLCSLSSLKAPHK